MRYPISVYLTCPLALPSWLCACLIEMLVPFEHPWYGRGFSLPDWYLGRTDMSCEFDAMMWFAFISFIVILR